MTLVSVRETGGLLPSSYVGKGPNAYAPNPVIWLAGVLKSSVVGQSASEIVLASTSKQSAPVSSEPLITVEVNGIVNPETRLVSNDVDVPDSVESLGL